ncbi:hypothetical protein YQE_01387, partial [Dendroctonus ponderosae]
METGYMFRSSPFQSNFTTMIYLKAYLMEAGSSCKMYVRSSESRLKITEESQAFTFTVKFNEAKRLIGLHEHPNTVSLMHTADYKVDPYRLKNVDYGIFGYSINVTQSMYGSIPVLYGFG